MHIDKSKVQSAFSKWAFNYDQLNNVQMASGLALMALIKKHVESFNCILDLGCGTGQVTKILKEYIFYHRLYAMDISPVMTSLSKQCLLNNEGCVVGDFDKMPFESHSMDLVFSNMSLQWSFDYAGTLSCIEEILTPGGYLAIAIPSSHCFDHFKLALNETASPNIINDFPSIKELQASLGGFDCLERVSLNYSHYFDNTLSLLNSIKKIGAGSSKKPSIHRIKKCHLTRLDEYFYKQKCMGFVLLDYEISLFFLKRRCS